MAKVNNNGTVALETLSFKKALALMEGSVGRNISWTASLNRSDSLMTWHTKETYDAAQTAKLLSVKRADQTEKTSWPYWRSNNVVDFGGKLSAFECKIEWMGEVRSVTFQHEDLVVYL